MLLFLEKSKAGSKYQDHFLAATENAKLMAQIKRLKKENQALNMRDRQMEKKSGRKKKKRVFDEGDGEDFET